MTAATTEKILANLQAALAGLTPTRLRFGRSGALCLTVLDTSLLRVARVVRDLELAHFARLENLSCAHLDDQFQLTYFLRESRHGMATAKGAMSAPVTNGGAELILKTTFKAPEKNQQGGPDWPSVTGVWPEAAPFEAEISEFFGIRFVPRVAGETESSRPYVGFPLRKDYVFPRELLGREMDAE